MLKKMKEIFKNDIYAEKLGIEILDARRGYSKVTLTITRDMLNGAGITHGAVVFAIVDLAFGVAANTHEKLALGLNMNISYIKATREGAVLTAEATEDGLTNRTGVYRVIVRDETGDTVAVAEGLGYRLEKIIAHKDGNE